MIILMIFKIIGILLLILLAVLLILLFLVLFVPVAYRANGTFDQNSVRISARASWLFHMLGVGIDDTTGHMDGYFRVLFIKRSFSDKKAKEQSKREQKDKEEEKQEPALNSALYIDSKEEDEILSESDPGHEVFSESKDGHIDLLETENDHKDFLESEKQKVSPFKKKSKKRTSPKAGILQKLQLKLTNAVSKLKEIGNLKDKATKFVNDSHNQNAIRHLKKEFLYLLKILRPGKMKLELQFSLGDPAYTGMTLGVLAMFPIGYQNRWKINPDFEADKAYAEGNFGIKGFLFGYQIIFLILRIIVDKECRRMYNKFMK